MILANVNLLFAAKDANGDPVRANAIMQFADLPEDGDAIIPLGDGAFVVESVRRFASNERAIVYATEKRA